MFQLAEMESVSCFKWVKTVSANWRWFIWKPSVALIGNSNWHTSWHVQSWVLGHHRTRGSPVAPPVSVHLAVPLTGGSQGPCEQGSQQQPKVFGPIEYPGFLLSRWVHGQRGVIRCTISIFFRTIAFISLAFLFQNAVLGRKSLVYWLCK